ncbi:MAG TPA: hypothetical protein VIY90_03870 [Steroidobacteraceae bacterium]
MIVGPNFDLSVRRLMGARRPAQSEVAPATILSALKPVDAVVISADDMPLALIETLLPDVLVKAPMLYCGAPGEPDGTKPDRIRPDHTAGDFLEAVQTIRTL